MKHLNLRALKSFHEIIQAGSATAAAERLGLSQPGVSRIIAKLEHDVGFKLFYREKGRLVPTAEGLLVFEEVSLAFSNIERINSLVRDIKNHDTGQLKIVASPSFSEGPLSDVVVNFLKAYPKVRLNIDSRNTETAKLLVVTRAADCGFAKLPFDRPDISAEKIVSCDTICALPRKHPLASQPFLTPILLKEEPLILLGRGRWSRTQVEDAFKKAKVYPTVKIETHTVGAACAFAAKGLGIAIVNELMARSFLGKDLVLRPFRPAILHEFVFITSALTPKSRLAQAFLDETKRYFAQQVRQ
ncbi:MAG: LysR family transcriptional regulator [Alphaproteobacteria bacterium]|nr:LysR family transcriptional regulator [Alphaproteobacteria bacterium]